MINVTAAMARVLCGLQHLGLHVFYNVPNDEIYDHENLEAVLGGGFGQPAEQTLTRKTNTLVEHARLGQFLKDNFADIVDEYGVGDYAGEVG